MRKFLSIAIIVSIFIVGCSSEVKHDFNSCKKSLYKALSAFFSEQTRTYVEQDKYIYWHEGDCLTVFYADNVNNEYQFEGQTGDNGGTFTIVESGTSNATMTLNRIYAVYPYDSAATIAQSGDISYHLPAAQNYAKDSFGVGANTMVAATESVDDTELYFSNLCGYLKIKLYGNILVKSIELKGNAGEKIAGLATIAVSSDGLPTVSMNQDASKSIVLNCDDGVAIGSKAEKATTFWFVVPPITFAEGITITVTSTNDEVFEKSTNKPVVIDRNVIHPMAAFEVIGESDEVESIANIFDPIFDSCSSMEELAPYVDQLKDMYGVAKVSTDDESVSVVLENGFVMAWSYEEWPVLSEYDAEASYQTAMGYLTTQSYAEHNYLSENVNGKLKVGILNQTTNISFKNIRYYKRMVQFFDDLSNEFKNVGFDTDIKKCEDLTYDFYANEFFDYDIIIWHTHGIGVAGQTMRWFLGAPYNEVWSGWDTTKIDTPTIGRYRRWSLGQAYQMVSPYYFKESDKKFKNESLIFAAVCGTADNIYDKAFKDKDVATYLGFDALCDYPGLTAVEMFRYMLQGMTVKEAYDQQDWKQYNKANLILSGDGNLCIVHPSVTTLYPTVDGGVVTMSGEVSGWNEYISGDIGFVWATHSADKGPEYELTVENSEGKAVVYSEEDSKPNNAFTFTTTEPQLNAPSPFVSGTVYVCRAYAKVHNEYVYGEQRLFVVDGGNNIIYYETTDGNVAGPKVGGKVGDAKVLSNTYGAGIGVIVCDKDISNIAKNDGFSNRRLKTINIPDSVTSIEAQAFFDCTGIEKIELGRNIVSFGNACFYNCTGHLIIKSNITNSSALLFAKFNAVTFSDGVTSCNCSFAPIDTLEFVYFGKDFENINSGMFSGCTKLKEVVMAADGNMVSIGNGAFSGCTALSKVSLANSIKSIGNNAFSRCIIESIKLPYSVVDIGDYAFNCKSLNKVEWSNNVISLGNYAFSNTSLDKVELPNSVKYIGNHVFADCTNLSQIKLSNNLESLGSRAFSNCICLSNITLPEKLAYIGAYAFENCPALTSIVIPDSVTAMGEYTFHRCYNLSSVVIGDGLESIPEYAFAYIENLKNVKLGRSVAYIRRSAFESCSKVTSIDFPDSLLIIGPQAFMYCGFKTVIIPRNVEQILSGAFAWCESLDDFYLRPTTPPLLTGRNSIDRHDGLKIHVPKASLELYKTAKWWSDECVLPYIVGY